jgi:prepilin-type N-terminal cleavage/methylation domain-containing protein
MMRRVREALSNQRGLTLPELLVSMVLFATVGTIATTGIVTVLRNQTETNQRNASQAQNRVGVELFTRLLRQATYGQYGDYGNAYIITTAEPQRIVFHSRFGAAPELKYVFELVGSTLQWGSVAPTSCPNPPPVPFSGDAGCLYPTYPTSTRAAVRGVRNAVGGGICPGAPADGTIFTYYEADATNGTLTLVPQPVEFDRLGRVASVGITLFTKENAATSRPGCEVIQAQVKLRNLHL